jgi:hypothetical protein
VGGKAGGAGGHGHGHSQFKVVSNKRNSLLATDGHPAGRVNRTTEKQEEALKGSEWRSDAYVFFL